MTDRLGIDLTAALADIVPLYFAEAEVNEYPFCVYSRVVRERVNKDGVYAILSELTLDVVADTYDAAKDCADGVDEAVRSLGDNYRIAFQSREPICTEGVWDFVLNYNVYQVSETN